ncbi:MAG TPA: hypothetical protein VNX26_02365 [Candidatus Acidoferrum sp.]|jgi:hypothetical protein|nr:hypothetical protein [Candidatus Acidoferrum sp.]
MTLEELFKACPVAQALYDEAGAYRVINVKTGARCRTFSSERASDETLYKPDPEFCTHQLWHGLPGDRGEVGLKAQIQKNIPSALRETAENFIRRNMPGCQHLDGDEYQHIDDGTVCTRWEDGCERSHVCVPKAGKECVDNFPTPPPTPGHIEISCSDYLKLTPEQKAGKSYSLKRNPAPAGFYEGGLVAQLRHAAGATPAPKMIDFSKVPNDAAEPVFVVRDYDEARRFIIDLKIRERLVAKEITPWYAHNCFYVCDPDARNAVLELGKAEATGALSWKPVVMTFKDPELESKLQSICTQVVTVIPNKEGVLSLAAVKAAVKVIVAAEKIGIPDMPAEVLDGWLGQICRERMGDFPIAFAWPALLAAASVLVPHSPEKSNRTNLYAALVGGKGTGKTSALDYALRLLNISSPPLMRLKAGSAEGLAKQIGDIGGASRLYFTDELEHLLLKAAIQGSTFATVLNTAFYEDQQELIIAHSQRVPFNCRFSLAGGVVDERFNDLFGAATTGGFYDRFIFGVGPSGYSYSYRSFSGEPLLKAKDPADVDEGFDTTVEHPVPVEISSDVWAERDRIQEELKIAPGERRVLELGIRCALIAASLDGRRVLKAADLGPMKAFVAYQLRVRKTLKPNPGKNPEAIVACKFLDYLDEHSPNGEFLNRRKMISDTRASQDWGPSTVNRVLSALELAGDIEQSKSGRQLLVRRVV